MRNLHPEQFQDLNEFIDNVKIYHGSPLTHFKPGDVIRPRVANGGEKRVSGTNNYAWARMYANKGDTVGAIYEVEPVGALDRFTDEQVNKAFKNMGVPYTAEYAADAWRVIGRYE